MRPTTKSDFIDIPNIYTDERSTRTFTECHSVSPLCPDFSLLPLVSGRPLSSPPSRASRLPRRISTSFFDDSAAAVEASAPLPDDGAAAADAAAGTSDAAVGTTDAAGAKSNAGMTTGVDALASEAGIYDLVWSGVNEG